MKSPVKTPMPALFTAGTLALALTACGGAAPEEPSEGTAAEETRESPAAVDVPALLDGLGETVVTATNYTLEVESEAPGMEQGDLSMSQTYQVMDDPEAYHCVSVMPYAGEMMMTMFSNAGALPEGVTAEDLSTSEYISHKEGELLLGDPLGLYGTGTPWVRSERTTRVEAALDFELVGLSDLVGSFSDMEQSEATGTERIDGVDTTVIQGTMIPEEVEALADDERAVVEGLLGRSLTHGMDVRLWVDEAGFPMRVEFSGAGSEVSLEFSSIGETSFEIPSEDEITDI